MTPIEGMTWVYDQIYIPGRTDPNIHVTEVDTTENPTLNAGEIDLVLSGLSKDDRGAPCSW